MDTVKICALGILVTVILAVVRQWNPSFDLPMKLAAALLFAGILFGIARPLIAYFRSMIGETAAAPYSTILMGALGVAVLTETIGTICRECRENAVAGYVELAGRLEILLLSLPLIEEILKSVRGMLG